MSAQLTRDLGQHLQQEIGQVMARQCAIAQQVLSPAELGIMLIEAAVSTTLTASATIAGFAPDHATAAELFDRTLDTIGTMAARDRARSLAAVAERAAV